MAMFGAKETQEQKEDRLLKVFDLDTMKNQDDLRSVRRIAAFLAGGGDAFLDASNPKDAAQYTRMIVEQNFIIIRQLDRLISELSK